MSIATAVRNCIQRFDSLQQNNVYEDGHRTEDELVRFKIWCGNVSAHRPSGDRSLEHRLRDSSNLKNQVLTLLRDLSDSLDRCLPSGEMRALSDEGSQPLAEHGQSSDEDDGSLDFEFDELAVQRTHPLQRVHDILDLLYQFSIALRRPAGNDRIVQGASSISAHSMPFDLDRVRSKYPMADEFLRERLARAMSFRRQYLKYRESHRAKLAAGLEADDVHSDKDLQSTLATSVFKFQDVPDLTDDAQSAYSVTSFAMTESETANLRPPPLPWAGRDGALFECPFCYTIQSFRSERMWDRHVYEDLQPYCCTFDDCGSRYSLYRRRRDWQRHQLKLHNNIWLCTFGCAGNHKSRALLEKHLIVEHNHALSNTVLPSVLDASARPIESEGVQPCPLCGKVVVTTGLWFKHVGRHMEQLALSSLPSHLLADEPDEDRQTDEGHVSSSNSEGESLGSDKSQGGDLSAHGSETVVHATEEDTRSRPGLAVHHVPDGPAGDEPDIHVLEDVNDLVKASPTPRRPTYPKIRREFLALEALDYYGLPWEYDPLDPDYIVILRDLSNAQTDVLFEFTLRLQEGNDNAKLRTGSSPRLKSHFESEPRATRTGTFKTIETAGVGSIEPPITPYQGLGEPDGLFRCPACRMAFTSQVHMLKHKTRYCDLAPKPHICPFPGCARHFNFPRELKRHRISTHHELDNALGFSCTICGKKFDRSDNRDRHLRNVHGGGKSTTPVSQDLRSHWERETGSIQELPPASPASDKPLLRSDEYEYVGPAFDLEGIEPERDGLTSRFPSI